MNHAVGVDASVAVKWVVDEDDTDRTQQLWSDSLAARRPVAVPPHFTGEVASALYQRTRRADPAYHLTVTEAGDALRAFLQYPVEVVTPPGIYEQTFTFAQTHGIPSIYDSLYVVFAQLLNVELWTADTDLLELLAGRAPWVRPISAYRCHDQPRATAMPGPPSAVRRSTAARATCRRCCDMRVSAALRPSQ